MLTFDPQKGELKCKDTGMSFAERSYCYEIRGIINEKKSFSDEDISDKKIVKIEENEFEIKGRYKNANVEVLHTLKNRPHGVQERITIKNLNVDPVRIDDIKMGWVADITDRPGWRLCSIPFKVQLDGSQQDYSAEMLVKGEFSNAVYTDPCREEPPLKEEGRIRSEAFAWGLKDQGITIIKYNNEDIELSVAFPLTKNGSSTLCFGGAGICLYGEPMAACELAPGQSFSFGETWYIPFEGGIEQAFYTYRDFTDQRGHGFPADYNPPLNWNELYDIGWFHSDTNLLIENYTREALLEEARLAKECHCDLLYLDPGWEVAEGTTIWDETRLGPVADLIKTLKDEFGLDLAYRTILRSYTNHFDPKFIVRHKPGQRNHAEDSGPPGLLWPYCLCNPEFFEEKLKRILAISKQGIKFLMFDEMDWRGYCFDPDHGHPVPAKPLDHVKAVYELAKEVKRQCPGLLTEIHDPVWPWFTAIYVPTYFRQGFHDTGYYGENWGFEYMWNCMDDLQTGKALSLYYYNLACNTPLYLHITMAADNDNSLFFWWCASTVRHLGIGGKFSHKTVENFGELPALDHERRFSNYKENTRIYKDLKPYFVRGRFWGLSETMHFHTLPGVCGGVLTMFNLTNEEKTLECLIPTSVLGTDCILPHKHAEVQFTSQGARVKATLKPMSPYILFIEDECNRAV